MSLDDFRPRGAQPLKAALAAVLLAAGPAIAQLPSPSTAGLGMGENYTGAARGYDATSWNPANLGLFGNPMASGAFFPAGGNLGLTPVTPRDLLDAGSDVPADVRQEWMNRIRAAGRQTGGAGADVTIAAVQVRGIGFQVSTSARALADLSPDAAELILLGEEMDEPPASFSLAGSKLDGAWTSTAALSFGQGFRAGKDGVLAFGMTGKYTLGHFLAYGVGDGVATQTGPFEADLGFPVVTTDTAKLFDNGAGFGLDLGAAWQTPRWNAGVALRNVVSTFQWKEERLRYRSAHAFFDDADTTASAGFDEEQPFSDAPADLRRQVLDLGYKPVLAAGVAFRPVPRLLVDADFRHRLGDGGMEATPQTHAGVGAEFRPLPWLPLRAGAAYVTGGSEVAGGVGLEIGSYAIGASIARRAGSTLTMVTLISSYPRLAFPAHRKRPGGQR